MKEKNKAQVVVIGGGPAGLSAASWSNELGLDAILIERAPDIGGQLRQIYGPIDNYLGLRARDGEEMISHFRASVDRSSFRRVCNVEVTSIDPARRELKLSNGDALSYRALIIATGVRRRRLNIEGETELRGKGVIESGVRDRAQASGRDVVIVGGGDAAVENALILSDDAASVTLIHRRDEFTARPEFLSELEGKSSIEVMRNVVVEKIEGGSRVTGVEIRNTSTGEVSRLAADIVLVRIGVEPNSQVVSGILDVDDQGYIVVDASGRTSVEGIYAAGDVANPVSPTLNAAAGTGATAAKSAYILIKTERNGV